jgi:PAS domain S-box-containing protein
MPSKPKLGLVFTYLTAFAIPVALGAAWTALHPLLQGAAGYLALLLVALIARFLGFHAAIAATASFAAVLWFHLLPSLFPDHPPSFLLIRIVLFVIAASIMASISRQTDVALRRAEKMCRLLVETSPDGIAVCDQKAEVRYANGALAQLVGAGSAEKLVGRNLIELAHPDSAAQMQHAIADASAPLTEMKWIGVDGRELRVEIARVSVRRRGEDLLHVFVRDLTARRKAEARLDETAWRMKTLFESAIDAILWADPSGRYVEANPAASALLGYSREEILTRQIGAFAPPHQHDAVSTLWRDVEASGSGRGDFTIVRKDGETREVDCMVIRALSGFQCAFLHDITGRKDAERSVQRLSARLLHLQDEERRRIARQLHDTTAQNLTALRLNLTRVQPTLAGADPAVVAMLDESVALTDESIGEIRTLSYLLHPPMIEDSGLLVSLRWYARGFESRSGIRMLLDLPAELSRLPLEIETSIFRIVQEALNNIQRHSGSAVAAIHLERRDHTLELRIVDEGHGIPAPLRDDDGLLIASGVGIAGIRERVRELGGRLHIQSRDDGTVVTISVPLPEN